MKFIFMPFMKFTGLFFVLVFTSLNMGCSPIYGIAYDYDKSFESVPISTYDWLPIPEEAKVNNLDEARIKDAVNAELQAKGLRLTSENPNFLIAADIVTTEKLGVTQWGRPYYYRYGGYNEFWETRYYQYEEGTFILDFVEPHSRKLIWRGTAKVMLDYADTPEKRSRLIKEAMQKILQNYPPPSG